MSSPTMPGQHHPALEREAAMLATVQPGRHVIEFPLLARPTADAFEDRRLTFVRRQAWGSLMPWLGGYAWTVWVDGLGREVGIDDVTYYPRPDALMYGEWNPVAP